jgi:Fur family ferric uptake transcriptional regulator
MRTDTHTAEQQLTEAIRSGGLRLTLPRRAICRILANSDEEFLTASAILEGVAATAGQIDASTVYRTLDELVRLGYLHHVFVGNQPGTWHVASDHDHQHLVCEACGRTTTIPLGELASTFDLIRTKYRFRPNAQRYAIPGYCDDCEPPDHSDGS